MKIFLDSSAFAKRFLDEPGSQDVHAICSEATELGLSIICVPEIVSALSRHLREKDLTRQEYSHTKQRLIHDARDAVVIDLTPDVIQLCVEILESNPVRTMDAIHVACARAWDADLFVSSDRRQIAAAKAARLKTKQI